MSWNYRRIKKDGAFAIHEVYYKDGVPINVTVDSMPACGDTPEELESDYKTQGEAFNQPILDYSVFEGD